MLMESMILGAKCALTLIFAIFFLFIFLVIIFYTIELVKYVISKF